MIQKRKTNKNSVSLYLDFRTKTILSLFVFIILFVLLLFQVQAIGLGTTTNKISILPGNETQQKFFITVQANESGNFSLSLQGPGASWITLPFENVSITPRNEQHFYPLPLHFAFPPDVYTNIGDTYLTLSTLDDSGYISSRVQKRLPLPFMYDAFVPEQETLKEETVPEESGENEEPTPTETKIDSPRVSSRDYEEKSDLIKQEIKQDKNQRWPLILFSSLVVILFVIAFFFVKKRKNSFHPGLLFSLHEYTRHHCHLKKTTEILLKKGWKRKTIQKHINHLRKHYHLYDSLYTFINATKQKGQTKAIVENSLLGQNWPPEVIQIYLDQIYDDVTKKRKK